MPLASASCAARIATGGGGNPGIAWPSAMTRWPAARSSAALEFSASNCAWTMPATRGGIRTGIKHLVAFWRSYTDSLTGGCRRRDVVRSASQKLDHPQYRCTESLDVGEIHLEDPQKNDRIPPRVVMDEDVAESHHAAERPCKLGLQDASLLEHANVAAAVSGTGNRRSATIWSAMSMQASIARWSVRSTIRCVFQSLVYAARSSPRYSASSPR